VRLAREIDRGGSIGTLTARVLPGPGQCGLRTRPVAGLAGRRFRGGRVLGLVAGVTTDTLQPNSYGPTGTPTNNGLDIDEVNDRFAEPDAPVTAIGADIETGRVYTLSSGSGCLRIGVHLRIKPSVASSL
jgi:hypothetical protein